MESSSKASARLPHALESLKEILEYLREKRPAVFLDYDGTLSPIVGRPELAVMSQEMRATLQDLARWCAVGIVSGRDLSDVRRLVGLEGIFYAGSHGFELGGPKAWHEDHEQALAFVPVLDALEEDLRRQLEGIHGVIIDRKKFSVAIHYRQVEEKNLPAIKRVVRQQAALHPNLRQTTGKKIFELQPDLEWHKGQAVSRLLGILGLDQPDVVPIYIGDDTTDEDAFRVLLRKGIGILVTEEPTVTSARFTLKNPDEVRQFLGTITSHLKENQP